MAPTAPTQYEREAASLIYDNNGVVRSTSDFSALDAGPGVRNLRAAVVATGRSSYDGDDVFMQPWFRDAHAFCSDVQRQASRASTQHAIHGWIWSTVGLTGVSFSTALTSLSSTKDEVKVVSATGIGLFSAVAVFGVYWLARSVAADHAATASMAGLKGDDRNSADAWARCLDARSNWTKENADATKAAADAQTKAAEALAKAAEALAKVADAGDAADAQVDGLASADAHVE